jgi:hypothetical protein
LEKTSITGISTGREDPLQRGSMDIPTTRSYKSGRVMGSKVNEDHMPNTEPLNHMRREHGIYM